MSHTQVQWARGATSAVGAYTGPTGELVLNTDDWTLQAQDGVTAGGHLVGAQPIPGFGVRVAAALSAAATSVTITADAFAVATALGGKSYVLANFNETFNGATTGAGGMDTGSLPTSGFVALYAIYNPVTQTAALLGTNGGSACPTIYGGARMPGGYTASALIAVWPTNSSAQLILALLQGRKVIFAPVTAVNATSNNTSPVLLSISSIVPPNAIAIDGQFTNIMGTSPSAGNYYVGASGDAAGVMGKRLMDMPFPATTGALSVLSFDGLTIPTPQTLYYINTASGTSPSSIVQISGYSW